MPGESFRFIQASDFHLETPLGDLDLLPPHLRDVMADAPRRAAVAVFEAALVDNIDFLVLCGDLISPHSAGPQKRSALRMAAPAGSTSTAGSTTKRFGWPAVNRASAPRRRQSAPSAAGRCGRSRTAGWTPTG